MKNISATITTKKAVAFLLLTCFLIGHTKAVADASFEDVSQMSDFHSISSQQLLDLRHTIPGIPGLDYPIYSEVPTTSFECSGKYEGYYADLESRCQAFRICTNTAPSSRGFAFLCPNGTMFNQRYFVCDWYRNVNCAESELYYAKNKEQSIGSSHEMLEVVRQMIEYPMKSIKQALAASDSAAAAVNRFQVAAKQAIDTRSSAKGSEAAKYVEKKKQETGEPQNHKSPSSHFDSRRNATSSGLQMHEPIKSQAAPKPGHVYVNNLGELSSESGSHFDQISQNPIHQQPVKPLNFAQIINTALNDFSATSLRGEVLAPDYIKQLRSADEGNLVHLASSINGLWEQHSTPPDSQDAKEALEQLRGDSQNRDYSKAEQNPSTVRFTNFRGTPTTDAIAFSATDAQHFTDQEARRAPFELQQPPHLIFGTSGIVIAQAEGKRIIPNPSASNSVTNSQAEKKLSSENDAYVPLNDFLHRKFNANNKNDNELNKNWNKQREQAEAEKRITTSQPMIQQQQQFNHLQNKNVNYQSQQQQQQLQQHQSQLYQEAKVNEIPGLPFHNLIKQQKVFQLQPQHKSLYGAQNAFISHHHHHQQQQQPPQPQILPQQGQPQQQQNQLQQQQQQLYYSKQQQEQQEQRQLQHNHNLQQQKPLQSYANIQQQQQQQRSLDFFHNNNNNQPNIFHRIDSVNIAIPADPNALRLPSVTSFAQRRSDDFLPDGEFESASFEGSSSASLYNGATSYDVPIKSIGRLPNDIQF